ncbi:hypothetical protein V1460_18515 [Streptomyces sp. SCSIO 30461]|uniref:hypothetical protein n=1 Tax=Streptomyces sp. SCSIO 30461 TaxID=3118085 RepID=UPI0030CC8A18
MVNHAGTPVYVHVKVCVIDDVWAAVGSDNVNLRSWTHDSELSCAVVDDTADTREPQDPGGLGDGARRFARELRLLLVREHLGREAPRDREASDELRDPGGTFDAFTSAAAAPDSWYERGCPGPRPPGRLRACRAPRLSRWERALAMPLYRALVDPDGRPQRPRRRNSF